MPARTTTKTKASDPQAQKVGDEALKKRTGKDWGQWFAVLDKAGAKKMTHKEIVAWLGENSELGGWWQQMVAVGYEQARGLRQKHEKAGGFDISKSKTLEVPVRRAFDAFAQERMRSRWLREKIAVRTCNRDKSIRFTWSDGTLVEARFYPKGADRTQVTVQHMKLPDGKAAERMKGWWGVSLRALAALC